jgi:hypothetical protein
VLHKRTLDTNSNVSILILGLALKCQAAFAEWESAMEGVAHELLHIYFTFCGAGSMDCSLPTRKLRTGILLA